jgi:hypothetical protein
LHEARKGRVDLAIVSQAASRLALKGDDGCFDLCVAMNGRNEPPTPALS